MKKMLTIILDGFGMREEKEGNAIELAHPENFLNLWKKYPHSLLHASEQYVGLESGQFGNSEVGHLTIGAGRKIKQPIDQMKEFIENDMSTNETYLEMINKINEDRKRVHIMGLCSNGKVHSDISQIINVYKRLVADGVKEIFFHIITDGRDTKTDISYQFIKQIEDEIAITGIGHIATICGRYYAMDRDHKWERTKKYYDLITKGIGLSTINIENTIEALYARKITDEFLEPILVTPRGIIKDNDILLWMNYRTDRARQILSAFTDPKFDSFVNYEIHPDVYSFVVIDKNIKTTHFLSDNIVENPLGIYLSKNCRNRKICTCYIFL